MQNTYTQDEFLAIRDALREELGSPRRSYSIQELVQALSPEIQSLRNAGRSDASIADAIRKATGHAFPVEELASKKEPWGPGPKHSGDAPEPAAPIPPDDRPEPSETPLEPSPSEPRRTPDENPAPNAPADIPSRSTPSELPSNQPAEIPSTPSLAPTSPSISPTIE
jgi:hypothetical protein